MRLGPAMLRLETQRHEISGRRPAALLTPPQPSAGPGSFEPPRPSGYCAVHRLVHRHGCQRPARPTPVVRMGGRRGPCILLSPLDDSGPPWVCYVFPGGTHAVNVDNNNAASKPARLFEGHRRAPRSGVLAGIETEILRESGQRGLPQRQASERQAVRQRDSGNPRSRGGGIGLAGH